MSTLGLVALAREGNQTVFLTQQQQRSQRWRLPPRKTVERSAVAVALFGCDCPGLSALKILVTCFLET